MLAPSRKGGSSVSRAKAWAAVSGQGTKRRAGPPGTMSQLASAEPAGDAVHRHAPAPDAAADVGGRELGALGAAPGAGLEQRAAQRQRRRGAVGEREPEPAHVGVGRRRATAAAARAVALQPGGVGPRRGAGAPLDRLPAALGGPAPVDATPGVDDRDQPLVPGVMGHVGLGGDVGELGARGRVPGPGAVAAVLRRLGVVRDLQARAGARAGGGRDVVVRGAAEDGVRCDHVVFRVALDRDIGAGTRGPGQRQHRDQRQRQRGDQGRAADAPAGPVCSHESSWLLRALAGQLTAPQRSNRNSREGDGLGA